MANSPKEVAPRFVCFRRHEDERFTPKWGPGENEHLHARDGTPLWHRFKRPFRCIVRKHQMADVIWAGVEVCLISNHILELFRAVGVTGYDVTPADVRLMFAHKPQDAVYWQMTVHGWGGMAAPESGIRRVLHPTSTRQLAYSTCTNPSRIIDSSQWDGSDFFIVWPLPNFWWITPKVVEVLQRHNLKRFRLLRPEELAFQSSETPIHGFIGFVPGRLRDCFPEERARQVGESLDIY